MPSAVGLAGLLDRVRDRHALHARHRLHRRAALAQLDEHRQDQVRGGEPGFAHELAQYAGLAQAAQACGGEGHRRAESRPRRGWGRATTRTARAPAARAPPKTTNSSARCSSGPARPPASLSAASSASSVGLKGKAADTTRITS